MAVQGVGSHTTGHCLDNNILSIVLLWAHNKVINGTKMFLSPSAILGTVTSLQDASLMSMVMPLTAPWAPTVTVSREHVTIINDYATMHIH